jgi:hypothetical protein
MRHSQDKNRQRQQAGNPKPAAQISLLATFVPVIAGG